MTVVDTDLIKSAQYRLLENGQADADGTTLLTDMFTMPMITDALNQRQEQWLKDTGMIVTRFTITGVTEGNNKYDLPADNIMVRRVTWQGAPGIPTGVSTGYGEGGYGVGGYGGQQGDTSFTVGKIRTLTRTDTWELDTGAPNWASDEDIPLTWWETTLPQQRIAIAKTPSEVGQINIIYCALAATLDGTGVALGIPDDWTPYILWGALADLLEHDGPAFDPARSQWCEQRYQEGVELARIVLMGSM